MLVCYTDLGFAGFVGLAANVILGYVLFCVWILSEFVGLGVILEVSVYCLVGCWCLCTCGFMLHVSVRMLF